MEWLPRHALLAVWVTSDVLVSACVILRSVAPAEPSAGVGDGTEAFAFGIIERMLKGVRQDSEAEGVCGLFPSPTL